MDNHKEKNFFERNDSLINTTGHVLNYLQNQQTHRNQQVLAEMSAINASLLDQQNQIRQKELKAVEKLLQEQKKKEDEEREKQEIKTFLLQVTPPLKGLIQLIEENNFDDDLQIGLLLNHVEVRLQEVTDKKSAIDDINFHDYVFNLNERLTKFKETHQISIEPYNQFLNNLANHLIEIRYTLSGAELIEKDPADIYKEKNQQAETYLSELYEKVKVELAKNESIDRLHKELNRYKSVLNFLQEKDSIMEAERYPLPLSYSEAVHLVDITSEIISNEKEFLSRISDAIKNYQLTIHGTEDSPFQRIKKISEKDTNSLTLDDLEYIRTNSKTKYFEIFSETLSAKLKKLSKSIESDFTLTNKLVEGTKALSKIKFETQVFEDFISNSSIPNHIDKINRKIRTNYVWASIIAILFLFITTPIMDDVVGSGEDFDTGLFVIWMPIIIIIAAVPFFIVAFMEAKLESSKESIIGSSQQEIIAKLKRYSGILGLSGIQKLLK